MDEMELRRKADFENLNQIPSIKTSLDAVGKDVQDIKDICAIIGSIKTDVDWLKKFFWLLSAGVITALIGLVVEVLKK